MQLVKVIFVAAALLVTLGQYFQEMHRLSVIKRLPPVDAHRYFEANRQRSETMLLIFTLALMAAATVAVVYTFVLPRSP